MKSMSGWKIPSPSSWSRRVISLVKEDRFENSASRRFPSQHSCSVRALLSPWERDAKDVPTRSTRFYRAFLSHNGFQTFYCAASCFEWLNLSEPCSGSTLFHLPFQLHRCFSETNPDPGEQNRALQSGTIPAQLGFAPGLFGEEWMFHIGCAFWPSCCSSSWTLPFYGCTASSHHAERADRNSRVSIFASCFNFTMVPELDTQLGLFLSVF